MSHSRIFYADHYICGTAMTNWDFRKWSGTTWTHKRPPQAIMGCSAFCQYAGRDCPCPPPPPTTTTTTITPPSCPPPPSATTTSTITHQAIPCNQIPKYLESNKYIMLQRCTITYIMQTYITHQCTQRDTSSVAFVKTLNHWPLGKYCGFKDIIYKVYTLLTIKIVSIELKKMSCCVFLKISLMILLKLTLVQIISRVSCQKGPTRHAFAWQIGPFWQDTLDIMVGCNQALSY